MIALKSHYKNLLVISGGEQMHFEFMMKICNSENVKFSYCKNIVLSVFAFLYLEAFSLLENGRVAWCAPKSV